MGKTLEQEVKEAIKKLQLLPKEFSKKERKKVLRKAAKPLIKAARNNIPKSSKPHHRYKTSKASSKIRAPKGSGKIIATYYPGNLQKSIMVLPMRKTANVIVGPKVAKRGKGGGDFGKGRRVDAYYAHFMEFGQRNKKGIGYMRNALDTSTTAVQNIIIEESKKTIEKFAKKHKI